MVDALEHKVDVGCEGKDSCGDLHVVFSVGEVVDYQLYAEVGKRIESLLGQEDSAYLLGPLQVTHLKSDELFQSVEVAVYCSVVPSR